MRDTRGKPVLSLRTEGHPALVDGLVSALGHTDRNDHLTHGFHAYPAGLHPAAAGDLLDLFPGTSVLDPFCGGGTVLVEALVRGREAVGTDISKVARLVSRLRTSRTDEAQRTKLRSAARAATAMARGASELPPEDILERVRDWYAPHVLCELESLRRDVLAADSEVRPLLLGVLSSILVKTSWRRSETSAAREPRERPAGTTAVLFHKKTRELARRLEALEQAIPEGTPPVSVLLRDARQRGSRRFELVITSPPYPSVYDYLPMQALRAAWFGGVGDGERELGPRRAWRGSPEDAVDTWRRQTRAWTSAVGDALEVGGHLVVVVGDGLVPAGPVDSLGPTREAMGAAGLDVSAVVSAARPDHARGTTRWEHAVVARRSA